MDTQALQTPVCPQCHQATLPMPLAILAPTPPSTFCFYIFPLLSLYSVPQHLHLFPGLLYFHYVYKGVHKSDLSLPGTHLTFSNFMSLSSCLISWSCPMAAPLSSALGSISQPSLTSPCPFLDVTLQVCSALWTVFPTLLSPACSPLPPAVLGRSQKLTAASLLSPFDPCPQTGCLKMQLQSAISRLKSSAWLPIAYQLKCLLLNSALGPT